MYQAHPRLLIWMHERKRIKLHVQAILRMNSWMFETCQRHCNYIKSRVCVFCWFVLHGRITVCILLVCIALPYYSVHFVGLYCIAILQCAFCWFILHSHITVCGLKNIEGFMLVIVK